MLKLTRGWGRGDTCDCCAARSCTARVASVAQALASSGREVCCAISSRVKVRGRLDSHCTAGPGGRSSDQAKSGRVGVSSTIGEGLRGGGVTGRDRKDSIPGRVIWPLDEGGFVWGGVGRWEEVVMTLWSLLVKPGCDSG